jgi:hypothetical protein
VTFDQQYFDNELKSLVSRIGGKPTVEMKLLGGDRFQVRDVVRTAPGYVTLEVRPASVATKADELVTVAYQAISSVVVSSTSAQQYPKVGFRLGP